MAEEKTTLEVIAPSVEEAVEKGLSDLGLSRDAVDVEVLDEGKRNLFRFATRQARVRLIVKAKRAASTEVPQPRETGNTGEIMSLMVSHKTSRWIPVQVEVQHYRARRQNELQKLARRTADQVLATGRKQYLEPMPANERRIIHMELRKNESVSTESIGEEPNRKVCVFPNK